MTPSSVPCSPAAVAAAILVTAPTLITASARGQSGGAQATDMSEFKATALEVTRLPRYCWGTYNPQLTGLGMEAYNVPPRQVCAERMNHFCPALVSLVRAKSDPGKTACWLGVANDHMNYTVSALREGSACPLRDDIPR